MTMTWSVHGDGCLSHGHVLHHWCAWTYGTLAYYEIITDWRCYYNNVPTEINSASIFSSIITAVMY